jgi:galactonate dehydratase
MNRRTFLIGSAALGGATRLASTGTGASKSKHQRIIEIKIAAMAATYNMRIQPHHCASPVSTAVAQQMAACIPNFFIQELYPYRILEHFQFVDHAPELDVKKGMLPISDRPGLGIEFVEERVKPFLWARCKL